MYYMLGATTCLHAPCPHLFGHIINISEYTLNLCGNKFQKRKARGRLRLKEQTGHGSTCLWYHTWEVEAGESELQGQSFVYVVSSEPARGGWIDRWIGRYPCVRVLVFCFKRTSVFLDSSNLLKPAFQRNIWCSTACRAKLYPVSIFLIEVRFLGWS